MGVPTKSNVLVSYSEHIGIGRQARELKHLSTSRKRKKIDSPSSGERNGNSLNRLIVSPQAFFNRGCRVCKEFLWKLEGSIKF